MFDVLSLYEDSYDILFTIVQKDHLAHTKDTSSCNILNWANHVLQIHYVLLLSKI